METKSVFPRSASPKGGGWGWEEKHYFPYQIPASRAINNVIHSNLPQPESENSLPNFVSDQNAVPENQSKSKLKETQI